MYLREGWCRFHGGWPRDLASEGTLTRSSCREYDSLQLLKKMLPGPTPIQLRFGTPREELSLRRVPCSAVRHDQHAASDTNARVARTTISPESSPMITEMVLLLTQEIFVKSA